MYSLLEALIYIHSHDIIHRDIKPENIMFDKPNGFVKMIDFGLATRVQSEITSITGSPYYIAPEVIKKCYSSQCDIWSLGVVLYQIMTGNMPFVGNTQTALFNAIKNKHPFIPYHLSDDLKDLLRKMLNKDPSKRITPTEALNHPWFKSAKDHIVVDKQEYKMALRRLRAFNGSSKLKRAALNVIAKQISETTH